MIRSRGHCNTMGTASTMGLVAEALGTVVPGVAGTPAADSRLLEAAHDTGRLAVEMVAADRRPSTGPDRRRRSTTRSSRSPRSAAPPTPSCTCSRSPGGSGIDLTLDDFDRIGSRRAAAGRPAAGRPVPDGGPPPRRRAARRAARGPRPARPGRAHRHRRAARRLPRRRRDLGPRGHPAPRASRWSTHGGIAVLRGNLAPDGAVIKPAAASPHLLRHRGRAVVFDSIEDFHARIDDPDLDVDADSVLVLRGCGPKGYPGMPEVSNMPLPTKLLEQGVRDMVRVCDGRMSGTAYGTVVLHVAPEAAAGGPLALVRTGDSIVLDVEARRIDVDVPADELAAPHARARPTRRRLRPPAPRLGAALRRPRAAGRHRRRPRLPRRLQRLGREPRVALSSGRRVRVRGMTRPGWQHRGGGSCPEPRIWVAGPPVARSSRPQGPAGRRRSAR